MAIKVTLKFGIGDKVYLIHQNQIRESVIENVFLTFDRKNPVERYSLKIGSLDKGAMSADVFFITEGVEKLFSTKEELVKSLLEESNEV